MHRKKKKKWNIDLSQSFFIGDTENDTEAAKNAGCKSILMKAYYNNSLKSDYSIANFSNIKDLIGILQK